MLDHGCGQEHTDYKKEATALEHYPKELIRRDGRGGDCS